MTLSLSASLIMSTNAASQFNKILWIFAAILVLYILFGVLFLVMSHLQERLQRRSGERSWRQYSLQPWDHASLSYESADKDLEAQISDGHPRPITFTINVDFSDHPHC
ncbi:hypothetical protein B0H14DRAFT_3883143 [Mycena olivaceomarginata]|nr:hypothetical protein B0H14DRAFT_3889363 [Mycena olivaceomarginata]KAJ7805082.1 hypothetical protein B0H14DRAFT_3883143 [Mycena olivaceomarginata]